MLKRTLLRKQKQEVNNKPLIEQKKLLIISS